MKNFKKSVIVVMTLVCSVSMARGKHRKRKEKPSVPYKYYYTVPVEASLLEWAYPVPECQSISKDEYRVVDRKDNCQDNAESKSRNCLSRVEVDLKNLKTNEKKKFGLNYVIYDTMKACEEAHAKIAPAQAAAPAGTPAAAASPAAEPAK